MGDADDRIIQLAKASPIASYRWKNRGRAPVGYIQGMAIAFAAACRDLAAHEEIAQVVAGDLLGNADRDVLDWYAPELAALDIDLTSQADRLRGVFLVLLGLGMRESSGKHCEGRDMSAQNVTAETAEAGLFQVSHNSVGSHPALPILIARFEGHEDLLTTFDEGVHCSASSWQDWGDGPGVAFQALTKQCPEFAVFYAAVLLRHARKHWGPINRKEAEVTADGAALLAAVRDAVAAQTAGGAK